MKEHLDALFDFIETHYEHMTHAPIIADLYGILYEIGSEWSYYQELFR